MTPELKDELQLTIIPLSLILDDKTYIDDENLNMTEFMTAMKKSEKISTACPSPIAYADTYDEDTVSFVVTLSSNLSGSYQSAVLGTHCANDNKNSDVYVFDSKSASAGEILIAYKIRELIDKGFNTSEIVSAITKFTDNMKTYFVLDDVVNFVKSGRLNKITGKIITALGVKPLLGDDGNGNIALYSHVRGDNQIMLKMIDKIFESGKNTNGETLVITHCNNQNLADRLKSAIESRYNFKRILIVPTRGLSSLHTNEKGLVMAF